MGERTDWGKLLEFGEENIPANTAPADRRRSPDW
jgi:hypothetical protein